MNYPQSYSQPLSSVHAFWAHQVVAMIDDHNAKNDTIELIPQSQSQVLSHIASGSAHLILNGIDANQEVIFFSRGVDLLKKYLAPPEFTHRLTHSPFEIATLVTNASYRGLGIATVGIRSILEKHKQLSQFAVSVVTRTRSVEVFQKADPHFTPIRWHQYPFLAFLVNTLNYTDLEIRDFLKTQTDPHLNSLASLYMEYKDHVDCIYSGSEKIHRTLLTNDVQKASLFEKEMSQIFKTVMKLPFPDSQESLTFEQFRLQTLFFQKIGLE